MKNPESNKKEEKKSVTSISDLLREQGLIGETQGKSRENTLSSAEVKEALEKEEFKRVIDRKEEWINELEKREKSLLEREKWYRNPSRYLEFLIKEGIIKVVPGREELTPGSLTVSQEEVDSIESVLYKLAAVEKEMDKVRAFHREGDKSVSDVLDDETHKRLMEVRAQLSSGEEENTREDTVKKAIEEDLKPLRAKREKFLLALKQIDELLKERMSYERLMQEIEREKESIAQERERIQKLEDLAMLANEYFHKEVKKQVNEVIFKVMQIAEKRLNKISRFQKPFSSFVSQYAQNERISLQELVKRVKEDASEREKLRAFLVQKVKEKGVTYEQFRPGPLKGEKLDPFKMYQSLVRRVSSDRVQRIINFAIEKDGRTEAKKLKSRIERIRNIHKLYTLISGEREKWVKKVFEKPSRKSQKKRKK